MSAAKKGLVLDDVSVSLDGEALLRVDAQIGPGETLTLMGPSGSGKSSLLGYVSGVLSSDLEARGAVWLDGARIDGLPPEERKCGLLFQDALLFPHLSVGGNLAFGLGPSVRGRAARRAAVETALAEADLAGFADRDEVFQLSERVSQHARASGGRGGVGHPGRWGGSIAMGCVHGREGTEAQSSPGTP